MSDLGEYFSDKDKIIALELQLFEMHVNLTKEIKAKSKYKRMYETLRGDKPKTNARGNNAKVLIDELKGTGKAITLIKDIAAKCFLSESHVKRLWYIGV